MDKTTDTTNSPTTNGSHQHAAAATATASSKAGGGGGISDRPPTSTLSSTTQQTHDNISLGCGPTTRLPTARTTATTTSTAVNAKDSNKITNMTCSSSSASAASTTQITAATKSLPKSTIINGKHCITQLGMPLPATLQQQNLAGLINLNINTTTGGNFGVTVDPSISVENLKKIIAKKLKVAKDRICLLHREKELQDGTLKDNNLMDGSKIILIPNVETGLLAQRPENTVMQALESLNDSQVNDFLSGKTPLNLSMRLGDHMMLIQLQLSTVNPANNAVGGAHQGSSGSCSSTRIRSSSQRSSRSSNGTNITAAASAAAQAHHSHHHHHHYHHNSNAATSQTTQSSTPQQQSQQNNVPTSAARKLDLDANNGTTCQRSITIHTNASNNRSTITTAVQGNNSTASTTTTTTTTKSIRSSDLSTFLSKRDYESLQNIVKSIAMSQPAARLTNAVVNSTNHGVNATTVHNQALRATLPPTNNATAIGTATPMSISTFHTIASAATASTTSQTTATRATAASSTPQRTDPVLLEQSPIKSLSNLVSSPIKTTAIKNIPIAAASAHNVNHNSSSGTQAATVAAPCQQDPIVAKLTSCLCTRLNAANSTMSARHCIENTCLARQDVSTSQQLQQQQQQLQQQQQQQQSSSHQQRHIMITSTPNSKSQAPTVAATTAVAISSNSNVVLHKTANNPITRSKHRHHHHHHHHHHHYHHHSATSTSNNAAAPAQRVTVKPQIASAPRCYSVNSNDSGFASDDSMMSAATAVTTTTLPPPTALAPTPGPSTTSTSAIATTNNAAPTAATTTTTAASTTNTNSSTTTFELDDSGVALTTDTRTLAEASRNLTQTLRKLSKEVFTNKIDLSSNDEAAQRKSGSGAVIESMKNHGKGIYSGTFSGTLNPALQDRYGRPKRDISTVIHILNDLLSATPQYSRGARISFEAPTTSAAAAAAAANGGDSSSSGLQHSSRNKQLSSKHHSHSCVKCIKAAHAHAHAHTSNTNSSTSSSSSSSTTANNNTQCNYGECNGHYKTHTKSVYACCQDATAATTATTTTTTVHNANANSNHNATLTNERNACNCRYRLHGETGEREREREYTCQKCLSDMDNLKTKSKMNQIRLVMQQTKQKREARKLKGAPYGARVLGATTTAATTTATAVTAADAAMLAAASTATSNPTTLSNATAATTLATTASPATSEVSPNHLVEEVDTAA